MPGANQMPWRMVTQSSTVESSGGVSTGDSVAERNPAMSMETNRVSRESMPNVRPKDSVPSIAATPRWRRFWGSSGIRAASALVLIRSRLSTVSSVNGSWKVSDTGRVRQESRGAMAPKR